MSYPQLRLVDNAVLAGLRAGTGRPIADGQFAGGDAVAVALASGDLVRIRAAAPWGLLWAIDGGSRSGPMADAFADAEVPYQVTCVGADRQQARWMEDKVVGAVLAGFSDPAGLVLRGCEVEPPAGVVPEGTLWNAFVRFRVYVTPS